jgi:hypothetical protein
MTNIERYNKQLRGNKFKLCDKIRDHDLVKWFNIGEIVVPPPNHKNDYLIDIFWEYERGYYHHNNYALYDIIRLVDEGSWILSATYLRKQKLKQLRND